MSLLDPFGVVALCQNIVFVVLVMLFGGYAVKYGIRAADCSCLPDLVPLCLDADFRAMDGRHFAYGACVLGGFLLLSLVVRGIVSLVKNALIACGWKVVSKVTGRRKTRHHRDDEDDDEDDIDDHARRAGVGFVCMLCLGVLSGLFAVLVRKLSQRATATSESGETYDIDAIDIIIIGSCATFWAAVSCLFRMRCD